MQSAHQMWLKLIASGSKGSTMPRSACCPDLPLMALRSSDASGSALGSIASRSHSLCTHQHAPVHTASASHLQVAI